MAEAEKREGRFARVGGSARQSSTKQVRSEQLVEGRGRRQVRGEGRGNHLRRARDLNAYEHLPAIAESGDPEEEQSQKMELDQGRGGGTPAATRHHPLTSPCRRKNQIPAVGENRPAECMGRLLGGLQSAAE